MSKELKEMNKKIDDDTKVLVACEDSVLSINTILNSLKLLNKSARKVYGNNEASREFRETILAVTADITSMKIEIEEVASDTADEINKLIRELKEMK